MSFSAIGILLSTAMILTVPGQSLAESASDQQSVSLEKIKLSQQVVTKAQDQNESTQQEALAALQTGTVLRRDLLHLYTVLRNQQPRTPTQEQILSTVKLQLSADGLLDPFAAVVDIAAEVTDTGNANIPAAKGSLQTVGHGLIRFESQHFGAVIADGEDLGCNQKGADKKRVYSHLRCADFSFGGTFGYVPTLTLVNLTNGSTPIAPPARPLFQQAFTWGLRPQINYALFSHGEIALLGEYGENILTDNVSSFSQSNASVTATLVSNGIGNGAPYWEAGGQLRLYSHSVNQTHNDKSFLTSIFLLEGVYRDDSRFHGSGDLSAFKNSEERFAFRFLATLNKVTGFKSDTEADPGATVQFGVERETPLGHSQVPPATRIIIKSNLDILKLLKPAAPQGQ